MAANPKRKGLSTLPVYLPDVPVQRAPAKKGAATKPQIYIEGAYAPAAAERLAQSLVTKGLDAGIAGEMLSSLPRGPQLAFRHKVATAGRGLAAALIQDGVRRGDQVRRGDVDREEESLHAKSQPEISNVPQDELPRDLAYDAASVQEVYRGLLPKSAAANIVVTSRVLRTWDGTTSTWTERPVVPGNPLVISASAAADADLAEKIRAALAG